MDDTTEGRHQRAWERFMTAERREVEVRCDGHLLKVLGVPILPGETRAGLERIGEEDRLLAEQGLVQMKDARGNAYHKHVDDLVPEDRADRARAHGARVEWLAGRIRKWRAAP